MAMRNDDGATNNNLNKKQMSYHNHDDEAKSIVSSSVTMEPEITASDAGMTESVQEKGWSKARKCLFTGFYERK